MVTKENDALRTWRLVNNELEGMQRPPATYGEIHPYLHSLSHPADIAFSILKDRCVRQMNGAKIDPAPKA